MTNHTTGNGTKPSGPVQIRMYNVGFGDCFLLTFPYSDVDGGPRNVLIDFGSSENPTGTSATWMDRVALDIRSRCEKGGLTAVIVTHRHLDHLSGFAGRSGGIIAKLNPKLVIQPWTEDPSVAMNATGPAVAVGNAKGMYIQGLNALHDYARLALAYLYKSNANAMPKKAGAELKFVGELNLKNLDAIKNLQGMGAKGQAEYLWYGQPTALEAKLPGVKIHVLGPPTPDQWQQVTAQTSSDPEFWMLYSRLGLALTAGAASKGRGIPLFPGEKKIQVANAASHQRWFIRQVDRIQREQVLSMVRALDDVMNNTSLILLFEVGEQLLLFPGDAQIESWRYALDPAQGNLDLFARATVYKVGHHGSRNATPHKLWDGFHGKGIAAEGKRIRTLMSTKPGKHGDTKKRTEVPRTTLVDELKKNSKYRSTQDYKAGDLADDV